LLPASIELQSTTEFQYFKNAPDFSGPEVLLTLLLTGAHDFCAESSPDKIDTHYKVAFTSYSSGDK